MFCSQCGAQVPDDSAFCHSCGATLRQSAGGDRQLRLHPAMVAGAAVVVLGVVLLILFLAGPLGGGGGDGGLGGGSDEDQVRGLLQRSVSYWNDRDWRGMYELTSPTDRATCSFEDFVGIAAFAFAFTGGEDAELREISVSVDGDRAYASYDLYFGGEYFVREDDDVFVKENGRWYDKDDDDSC